MGKERDALIEEMGGKPGRRENPALKAALDEYRKTGVISPELRELSKSLGISLPEEKH